MPRRTKISYKDRIREWMRTEPQFSNGVTSGQTADHFRIVRDLAYRHLCQMPDTWIADWKKPGPRGGRRAALFKIVLVPPDLKRPPKKVIPK